MELDDRLSPTGLRSLRDDLRKRKNRRIFEGSRIEMAQEALKEEPGFPEHGLDPWQFNFLECNDPKILENCSRQIGKSTTASIYALHTAMFEERSLILIFAPALRQSQELFAKLMPIYYNLGELVESTSEQKLTLELINGSRIVALPGAGKTTRGFSRPRLVILDEAAQAEDDLYYDTVTPMMLRSINGQIMLLSTPYGRRGFFWKLWMHGVGWRRFRVPVWDVPSVMRTRRDFIEAEREEKPYYKFAQEYECKFVDTEDQFFPSEYIESAYDPELEPLF